MSNYAQLDDVSLELSTLLDEFSAVDCQKLKKNAPAQKSLLKNPLPYNHVLYSDSPSALGLESRQYPKLDMAYIDLISGRNIYLKPAEASSGPKREKNYLLQAEASSGSKRVEASSGSKITLNMEDIDRLCYQPKLPDRVKSLSNHKRMAFQEQTEQPLVDKESSVVDESKAIILNKEKSMSTDGDRMIFIDGGRVPGKEDDTSTVILEKDQMSVNEDDKSTVILEKDSMPVKEDSKRTVIPEKSCDSHNILPDEEDSEKWPSPCCGLCIVLSSCMKDGSKTDINKEDSETESESQHSNSIATTSSEAYVEDVSSIVNLVVEQTNKCVSEEPLVNEHESSEVISKPKTRSRKRRAAPHPSTRGAHREDAFNKGCISNREKQTSEELKTSHEAYVWKEIPLDGPNSSSATGARMISSNEAYYWNKTQEPDKTALNGQPRIRNYGCDPGNRNREAALTERQSLDLGTSDKIGGPSLDTWRDEHRGKKKRSLFQKMFSRK